MKDKDKGKKKTTTRKVTTKGLIGGKSRDLARAQKGAIRQGQTVSQMKATKKKKSK